MRKAQSAEELKFQAQYIRALGIAGMVSCPVLIMIGLLPLVSPLWSVLLICTGVVMGNIGIIEYRVSSKVLRHLPA